MRHTKVFKSLKGSNLHDLGQLLEALPDIRRAIESSKGNKSYKEAWDTVKLWRNDKLRYSDKKGDKIEASKFIDAVKKLHRYLLIKQLVY